MSGRRKIGARETYFPPFVNERFDGPPYWACTFTALLNGANVGFLGNREAEPRRGAQARPCVRRRQPERRQPIRAT